LEHLLFPAIYVETLIVFILLLYFTGGLLINIFGLVMFGSHAHAGHDHSHGNHDHNQHDAVENHMNGDCQKKDEADTKSGKSKVIQSQML